MAFGDQATAVTSSPWPLSVARASDGTITVWDAATGECKLTLQEHSDWVQWVAWSRDSKYPASSSSDNIAKIWGAAIAQCKSTLRYNTQVNSVAWSPDGTRLVSGTGDGKVDSTVNTWDITTGECQSTLKGTGPGQYVIRVAWSSNDGGVGRQAGLLQPASAPRLGIGSCTGAMVKDIVALQDHLYLLEPKIRASVEQSTTTALDAISNGLAKFNDLLDFWPEYTGDDATNERRKAIIKSGEDYIASGVSIVGGIEKDITALGQLLEIEKNLKDKKAKFMAEAGAEQVELDGLKSQVQAAVDTMIAKQKAYQVAQDELSKKLKTIAAEEDTQAKDDTILTGIEWYKNLLRSRTFALEPLQVAADLACLTWEIAEANVYKLQGRQQALNQTHKGRPFVQREIGKAEMIVAVLKTMSDGLTREEERIIAVVNLMSEAIADLDKLGEPPYHRPHRRIEDQLCTTILMIHRESLVDERFAASARGAVAQVKDWFDDDMPAKTEQEIKAIENNAIYKTANETVLQG